ncbi:hypothetical protein AAFC00_001327 [Neodothiora populina]|uniref:C2H2-type domain-containing protein n=1 Tax=Neodothiora populina TaxID=2781224 RepID=A0ABR3PPK4_9PEZI
MAVFGRSKRKATCSGGSLPSKRSRVDGNYEIEGDSSYGLPSGSGSPSDGEHSDMEAEVDHGNLMTARSTPRTSTQPSTPPTTTSAGRSREKRYVCEFPDCGKAYTRPVRLAEHQRSHTNERPFVCTHEGCDKSFLRESHLKHHIKAKHDDVRDYLCDHLGCDKAFHTGTRLREHKKIHDKVKQEFKCQSFPPCDQEFRKQETLDRHIQLVHLNEKPFVCDYLMPETGMSCGARFKTSTHLIGHKDREHSGKRFWCKICSPEMAELDPRLNPDVFETAVGFPTYTEMQQHVKLAHPPTCDQCGHVCASNRDLKAHIDIQHGALDSRRTFMCDHPDCGRGFTKKGNLDVHKRNVHAKQKQFVCGAFEIKPCTRVPYWDGRGACGRACGTKASLEEHVRTQHLHLPRSTRKSKNVKTESMDYAGFSMEPPQAAQSNALAMLTGIGYDSRRSIACVEAQCPYRMQRYYDLEVHLKAAHGYSATEAIDIVKEQEALSGGDFWVGGDPTDLADAELAQRLQALDPADTLQDSWMVDDY